MMVCVICMFVVTYGFTFGVNIVEIFLSETFTSAQPLSFLLADLGNTLIVFNSANTSIVYAVFSRKYCRHVRRILCHLVCLSGPHEQNLFQRVSSSLSGMYRSFLPIFSNKFEGCEPLWVSRQKRGFRITDRIGRKSRRGNGYALICSKQRPSDESEDQEMIDISAASQARLNYNDSESTTIFHM